MAVSREILRHVQAAVETGDSIAEAVWRAKYAEIEVLTAAEVVKQLPVETPTLPQQGAEQAGVEVPSYAQPASRPDLPQIYVPTQGERLILPSTEQVVGAARKELKDFFGKDFNVPEPSEALFHTLERFGKLGIRGFEPHYLPEHNLGEKDKIKGWKVKPEPWFWQQLRSGSIETGAATLQEGWYLVDGRGKPQYRDGQQMYEDDYLAPLMESLRGAERIHPYQYVPRNSRFGASPDEIEQTILPEFTAQAKPEGAVRNMRYIEFNVLGNMAHPEWGRTKTWQWFGDKFGGSRRLFSGSSDGGGLSNVSCGWSDYRIDLTGFSPAVAFPSKTG